MNIILNIIIQISLMNQMNYKQIKPTQYDFYHECIRQEILFPDIVLQQAITETGNNFEFSYNNNYFGFRNKSGYLKFINWLDCIAYYKSWQDRKYPKFIEKTNKTDYYEFICWVGWKDGKNCSNSGKKYIKYLKSIKFKF